MVCKKCGYSTLIQDGDWLKCPNCGAEFFNTQIDFGISARDELNNLSDKIESVSENNSEIEFNDKEEFTDISKDKDSNVYNDTFEDFAPSFQINRKEETNQSDNNNDKKEFVLTSDDNSKESKKHNKKNKKKKDNNDKPKKVSKSKEPKQNKHKSKKSNTESNNNDIESNEEEKSKSKFKDILDFITPIVIAVIIALLLKTFVFANAVIPTPSMVNTIKEKDRIIASRLAYIKDDPERYDIVLFNYPDDEKVIYVKRIIGLPGETVTVINGIVYVQDKDGKTYQTDQTFITNEIPKGDFGPYYIPYKGEKIKSDGEFCYAENGMIVGKVQFIQQYCEKDKNGSFVTDEEGRYIVAENNYFCMGDNRNHSLDSRYWENTYVSKSKMLGKVLFRYFPSFEQLK